MAFEFVLGAGEAGRIEVLDVLSGGSGRPTPAAWQICSCQRLAATS